MRRLKWKPEPLLVRFALIALALSIVPVAVLGYLADQHAEESFRNEYAIHLGSLSRERKETLRLILAEQERALKGLVQNASLLSVAKTLDRLSLPAAQSSLATIQQRTSFIGLLLTDSRQTRQVTSGVFENTLSSEWTADIARAFKGAFVRIEVGKDGNPMFILGAPLAAVNGATSPGVLLAWGDPRRIDELFGGRTAIGRTGESFIADRHGRSLTMVRYGHEGHPEGGVTQITAHAMQNCLQGENSDFILEPDYVKVLTVMSYRNLPEIGGGCLMVHVRADEALSVTRAFRLQIFILVGLVMAAVFPAALYTGAKVFHLAKHKQANEMRLATIVDSAGDAILSTTLDGVILSWNPGAERLFGYRAEEMLGQNVRRLIPPDRVAEEQELIERIARGERVAPFESIRIHKGGTGVTVSLTISLLTDESGRAMGTSSIIHDITARKRVEQQLRIAKDQAEQVARDKAGILAVVEAFFIGVNQEGLVTEWAGQAEKLFGISLRDALDRSFKELPIRWNWDEVLGAMRQAGDSLKVVRLDKLRVMLREEKEAFLKMTVSPVCDDRGIGYIIMGEDVTDRLVLEHELAQAQKLESIGQLAAGIAHEINTPTQFIGDNVRFLSDSFGDIHAALKRYREVLAAAKSGHWPPGLIETCDTEAQQADLDYLSEEIPKAIAQSAEGIERVAKIVRAMKEFAHPGSDEKIGVDLTKAIESTVTVTQNEWKYVADLAMDLDSALPLVPCLLGQFNQVILNMIINAAHAIAEKVKNSGCKGIITITSCRNGDFAEIRIADNGAGIPEAIRGKIFDPFFTTKEVGQGTGQGLAIARSVVVDKHQGMITVESQVGKGTTFIIRLPLSVPANSETMERAA